VTSGPGTRAAIVVAALACLACGARGLPVDVTPTTPRSDAARDSAGLSADLDTIFNDPVLSRALMAVVVADAGGSTIYQREAQKLTVPASNMKLLTMAVAADRLGWDYRFETTLEASGTVSNGVLDGDLIVVGGGDPSIAATATGPAPVFTEWADALLARGIRRVTGRLLGDDDVFEDEGRGAGWAWDNLTAGYSAPAGGLSYNENVVVLTVEPGTGPGDPARITATAGHPFVIENGVETGSVASAATLTVLQDDDRRHLRVSGQLPAGGEAQIRTTAVADPTRFFVDALLEVLVARGIAIDGGARDLDAVDDPVAGPRVEVARRRSPPLSALASRFMKSSQNFYGEMLLKSIGHAAGDGSAEMGRRAVLETLGSWGVPVDAVVMYDGSGLSRYNYVTADAILRILQHVWSDPQSRGPYLALLPVGGVDGTLEGRMTTAPLAGRVQAKTGTINNMRALSGYLHARSGRVFVFSMIANHVTAPTGEVDAIVERALARLTDE